MNVLIGCEVSGVMREAWRALGHNAWSCDLKPAADSSRWHYQMDVREVLYCKPYKWDVFICHPDCTYLTNSAAWAYGDGPYHQKVKPGTLVGAARRNARLAAAAFFLELWQLPIERKVFENPIGTMSRFFRKPDQIFQPYQFGDDASKATCLWLQGLDPIPIDPALYCPPRLVCDSCRGVFAYGEHKCPKCGSHEYKPRWSNQTDSGQNRLTPSDERAAVRANTYPGFARAAAAYWGGVP